MTRAYFVTTTSNEMPMLVDAWRLTMGPAEHVTFLIGSSHPDPFCQSIGDDEILRRAREYDPDVILYSGANGGPGMLKIETFQELRKIAPSIHYQGDLEDESWWDTLETYRDNDCFDLCVANTGVHVPSLTDYATLTVVNITPYKMLAGQERTVHCGFPGGYAPLADFNRTKRSIRKGGKSVENLVLDPRSVVLHSLSDLVTLKERRQSILYEEYASFLLKTRLVFNTSRTGSGNHHHVKGRVVEAAFAGCALLEMRESPTKNWFSEDTYFQYGSVEEARGIIRTTPNEEIDRRAVAFHEHAMANYLPEMIFGEMMNRLGI